MVKEQNCYLRLCNANLLQSYDYARAIAPLYQQKIRIGIIKINNLEAGLVQVLEAGHPRFLHAIVLDRGPLWFEGYGLPEHIRAFFEEFNRQFPRRIFRRRRIVPEIHKGTEQETTFLDLNFKARSTKGYQTIWIDVQKDEDLLYADLSKGWKHSLKKAAEANLSADWDDQGRLFEWFMKGYQIHKRAKNYPSPSPAAMQRLHDVFTPQGKMLIGRAMLDNRPVGAILLLCHGRAATYQVGWVFGDGRACGANHFLLWDSLRLLKEKGVYDLDLGGINDESAKGVKQFKQGMGGQLIELVGHYA